ncbi:rho guanine nucleotide exchange factor 11 [Cinclus cinclus]|uniref:rho guanine nucleotide exchange factor 11 n=1 Tax=Cinclus cinclus TaxID=127875 RepID=UPI002E161C00
MGSRRLEEPQDNPSHFDFSWKIFPGNFFLTNSFSWNFLLEFLLTPISPGNFFSYKFFFSWNLLLEFLLTLSSQIYFFWESHSPIIPNFSSTIPLALLSSGISFFFFFFFFFFPWNFFLSILIFFPCKSSSHPLSSQTFPGISRDVPIFFFFCLFPAGAYVALTLLGSPPGSVGISGSQQEPETSGCPQGSPSCPFPVPPVPPVFPQFPQLPQLPRLSRQDPDVRRHAAQILWNMLRQEEAELQRFQELQLRNPGRRPWGEQLEGARRRLGQLQLKILQEDLGFRALEGEVFPQLQGGFFSMDSQDGDPGLESGEVGNSGFSDAGSPRGSPDFRRFPTDQGPQIIGPEEEIEPGNAGSESDSVFQDLGILKSHPAHLGVFLRFLLSQADPTALLFQLCSELCCRLSNPREFRGLAREIWNLFLDGGAPLRVKVSEQLLTEIEGRLRSGEDARPALRDAQEFVLPQIREQLRDYRTKRTLGLGNLYGENELQELERGNSRRDPRERRERERALAERLLGQLGDILSKYEEERSSAMAFALNIFMAHSGIRPREFREFREFRNPGASEKIPDKDKWLPFFPKAKKVGIPIILFLIIFFSQQSSSSKKEKEKEQRQNLILKYIGKPRSSSQSTFHVPLSPVEAVRPGNVRTMIRHFENNHGDGDGDREPGTGPQRLSTGSVPDGVLEHGSPRPGVRLGRSGSLKGRGELRGSRGAEPPVPRSRSDAEVDAGAETPRLRSASSSASSLSNRSLENPTPPFTPKMGRRSMDSPSLGFGADPFLPNLLEDEQGLGPDPEPDPDSQSWQHSVSRELVANLTQREVDRQEVINELFVTELSHLRVLRVLDCVFYQRLRREQLLSQEELGLLFPNLPELIDVHMSGIWGFWDFGNPQHQEFGDFGNPQHQEFGNFGISGTHLVRNPEAESNPQCRRLQLKDLIVSEMQRLTKYPLLLDSIIKCTPAGSEEQQKLCRAREHCRDILRFVNDAVRGAENRQRLQEHQRRLDTTALERTSNPLAAEFRNLDLTSHRMIHEGPLTWRVGKDKSVELHVLLLEELLVLLQRQDERLVLKCHSKGALGASSDTKQSFSPVLKLSSLLVRSVATDKRALFIICTSELGPQIYELVALTSSEKNTWMELLEQAVQGATRSIPGPPKRHQSEASGTTGSGLVLPERAVSPGLARGSEAEPEDCPTAGAVPTPSGRAPPPLELPGDPGGAGIGDPDPKSPRDPDPDPGIPKSPAGTGVAEAALEDVETLRLLIVRRLRPGRDPDPEDDVTPTPSVAGAASGQAWNFGMSSREFPTSAWDSVLSRRALGMSGREFPMSSREFPVSSRNSAMFSRDFPVSSRDFPVSSQEFPVSSRDFPVSSRDFPVSSRDFPVSSRDFPVSSRDFPVSSRDFPVSSQEFPVSSQEFPMSSRNSAMSTRDFPVSSQEFPVSSQEFPVSSRDFPVSSQEFPVSSQEFPMSSRDFPVSSRDFPVSSQDFPVSSRDFPISSQDSATSNWDFPMSSQEFPISSRDLPMSSQEFPISSRDLPMSSQEFPISSRDSATSGRDSVTSSQDSVTSSQEFPMSSQDSVMSSRDSAMSSWEFPMSSQEFPVSSQEFPMSSQEFPVSSQEFPVSHQEFPVSHQEFPVSSQEFPVSGRDFPVSSQEFPVSSQEFPVSGRDSAAQEGSREEPELSGIQIKRKAQEEGSEKATPPHGCSQSEPELREGGGASTEGNFFYLSLPTGPPQPGGDVGDTPGDVGDVELILGTLEGLRGKLLRLRALEVAHRQLLRSLGGSSATAPDVPNAVPSVPSSDSPAHL